MRGQTYHGQPCKNCSSTLKYLSGHSCVACSLKRYKDMSAEKRAARKIKADQYRAEHGHAYSKEKMKEYNRVYQAKKKGVDPDTYRIRGEIPLDERILEGSMPAPECGCWIWLGRLDKDGYGHISVDGRSVVAPRASLLAFKGLPLSGYGATRHICDFPPCVNPDHLLPGTNYENIQDRVRRGRSATKLTKENVVEIRRRRISGERMAVLADEFNVATHTIWTISNRRTWKHVP